MATAVAMTGGVPAEPQPDLGREPPLQCRHALVETGECVDLGREAARGALQDRDIALQLANVSAVPLHREPQLPDGHLETGVSHSRVVLQPLDPLLERCSRRLDRFDRGAALRPDLLDDDLPGRLRRSPCLPLPAISCASTGSSSDGRNSTPGTGSARSAEGSPRHPSHHRSPATV